MAEETFNESFPDLKELENKTGRKIPESLLMWMKDAADCEDGWRSDVVDRRDQSSASSDSFTDKINNLKQDMRWLRSADVRILRQLVAVHEGIEAMRWLMEERGTLTSRGSSLTGSLSSLATVEEHGPSMSPCRESPSPTCEQDLVETISEEPYQQLDQSDSGNSNPQRYLDRMKSSESRNAGAFRSSHRNQDNFSVNPPKIMISGNVTKSEPQDSSTSPLKDTKDGANVIRRALLRSSRSRRALRVHTDKSFLTQEAGQTSTVDPTQDSRTASQTMEGEEESTQTTDKLLLDYDAQWCWVESQDDVTFL